MIARETNRRIELNRVGYSVYSSPVDSSPGDSTLLYSTRLQSTRVESSRLHFILRGLSEKTRYHEWVAGEHGWLMRMLHPPPD